MTAREKERLRVAYKQATVQESQVHIWSKLDIGKSSTKNHKFIKYERNNTLRCDRGCFIPSISIVLLVMQFVLHFQELALHYNKKDLNSCQYISSFCRIRESLSP